MYPYMTVLFNDTRVYKYMVPILTVKVFFYVFNHFTYIWKFILKSKARYTSFVTAVIAKELMIESKFVEMSSN